MCLTGLNYNPPLPPTTLTGVKRAPPLPTIITLPDTDDEDLFGDSDDDEDLFPRKKKQKMQCPEFKEGEEDMIAFYDRAIAYYRKAVDLQEMNRMYDCKEAYMKSEIHVQCLRLGMVKKKRVYTAEELHEKVQNAKKMVMFYSCSRAFAKLEHCCKLHEKLNPVEKNKYIFELGGWRSKDDWDKTVKAKKVEMDIRMKELYPDEQLVWKGNSWLGH